MATAWGIDIGRRTIKGVRLRDTSTGPMLDIADSVEVELKPKATDADKEEAGRNALLTFARRHGIRRGDSVFLSIPGHTTFNRVLRIPVVDEKKLLSTIRFEAQQQIPFPIEEVVWDYHPLPQVSPGEMEISLFAVKNEFIRKFLHNLDLIGLEPRGIQIAPLALFNFARFELEMRGANLVMDMGSDATDLLVIDQDKTWMRTIPIAGNEITRALEKKFNLPFEEAEKLKIKSEGSKQAQKIFSVMKPVLTDIFSEVGRSLNYYKSQVPDVVFKECLVLGNGSRVSGIRQFIKESIEIDSTRVTSLRRIAVGPSVNLEFLNANLSGLSVAFGLALQALGKADNNVNFMPRELLQFREAKRRRPWFAAAAAVLVVAALASVAARSGFRDQYRAAVENSAVVDRYDGLSSELESLKDNAGVLSRIDQRIAPSEGRDWVARAYKEAMDVVAPAVTDGHKRPGLWLISLDVAPKEGFNGPGSPLTVTMTGAIENIEWKKMDQALAALGENPADEAASEIRRKFSRELEADVKGLVLNELQKRGRTSAEQHTGTFVGDLSATVRKGTRFYKFKITWDYQGME